MLEVSLVHPLVTWVPAVVLHPVFLQQELSNLYSKAASTPSPVGVGNQNVNTGSTSQSLTFGASSYVSDTYGGTLTYSVNSYNSSYISSATINSSTGTLSYSIPYNKFANTTSILITVTNRFGRTATITVPIYVYGVGPSFSSLGSASLTNNTYTWTLSSYVTDYSGTTLTYSVTANPQSNASISSGVLSVVGNNRGASYTVTVQVSNGYGQTASSSATITEAAPVSLLGYYPTYNNYYTVMTRNTNAFTISQAGSDPNVQLQMNSSSTYGSITHTYYNFRLQDWTTASIEFEIYISSTAVADALFFYMGYNGTPPSTYYEGVSSTAYQLAIEIYQWASLSRGFHLIKNGSTTAVASYATTSHISSTWMPVKIVWNKSATNTFQIYFNNTNIINYSDANYASYVSGSGNYWGIGSRTGGAAGDMYIRRVRAGVPYTIYNYSGSQLRGTSGLTLLYDGNSDDSYVGVTIPFTWTFLGTNYGNGNNGGVYVGTNSYISFGGSSTSWSTSATNPALKTIHIGSRDNSLQRLYGGYESANNWYRLRFEGTASSSGTAGSPNIVWECLILNQANYGQNYNFWFCTGSTMANTGGLNIVSDGTNQLASYTLSTLSYYEFRNFQ